MAMFRYTAKNARGEDTAGVVDATSLEEALERLLQSRARDVQVTHMRKTWRRRSQQTKASR